MISVTYISRQQHEVVFFTEGDEDEYGQTSLMLNWKGHSSSLQLITAFPITENAEKYIQFIRRLSDLMIVVDKGLLDYEVQK
jgi:hypothetical protein